MSRSGKSRTTGVWLLLAGVSILLAAVVAPVPGFDRLQRREGVVQEVRVEEIRFCRPGMGDCVRTMVDVEHGGQAHSYNFAQTPASDVVPGEPIDVWVAPAIRGLPVERVWHAEQGSRVLREYAAQARTDRTIRWVLLGLAPLLLAGGYAVARRG